jgi:hypothetical protein
MSTASPAADEILEEEGVILSPEEEAEMEAIFAEADAEEAAGQVIPMEQFCAERGIPWKPSAG